MKRVDFDDNSTLTTRISVQPTDAPGFIWLILSCPSVPGEEVVAFLSRKRCKKLAEALLKLSK